MGFQCEHHVNVDRAFRIDRFCHIWYHDCIYEKVKNTSIRFLPTTTNVKSITDRSNIQNDYEEEYKNNVLDGNVGDGFNNVEVDGASTDNDEDVNNNGILSQMKSSKQIYREINNKASTLARLIQGDQQKSSSVLTLLDNLIDRAQQQQSLDVAAFSTSIPELSSQDNYDNQRKKAPVVGCLKIPTSSLSIGRFKSSREPNSSNKRRKTIKDTTRERTREPPVSGTSLNATKNCSFCKKPGHQMGYSCPLISRWNGEIIPKKNINAKEREIYVAALRTFDSYLKINHLPGIRHSETIVSDVA